MVEDLTWLLRRLVQTVPHTRVAASRRTSARPRTHRPVKRGHPTVPAIPGPDDLATRIRALETRVDELARGTLSHAVISQGGIQITDLGGIQLVDNDGETVFFVGGIGGSWSRPDGTPQPVTAISDDRGRWRVAVFDPDPHDRGYRQFVAIFDYNGNIVLGDDVDSGEGLARPYLPHFASRSRHHEWPATSATGWEAVETLRFNRQHPILDVHVRCTTDNPDTRGEVRVRVPEGDVVLGSEPIGFAQELKQWRVPMPGSFGQVREVHLEARRTTGSGNVRASFGYASGIQSG